MRSLYLHRIPTQELLFVTFQIMVNLSNIYYISLLLGIFQLNPIDIDFINGEVLNYTSLYLIAKHKTTNKTNGSRTIKRGLYIGGLYALPLNTSVGGTIEREGI